MFPDSIEMTLFYYGTAVIAAIGALLWLVAYFISRAEEEPESPRQVLLTLAPNVLTPKYRAALQHSSGRRKHRAH